MFPLDDELLKISFPLDDEHPKELLPATQVTYRIVGAWSRDEWNREAAQGFRGRALLLESTGNCLKGLDLIVNEGKKRKLE